MKITKYTKQNIWIENEDGLGHWATGDVLKILGSEEQEANELDDHRKHGSLLTENMPKSWEKEFRLKFLKVPESHIPTIKDEITIFEMFDFISSLLANQRKEIVGEIESLRKMESNDLYDQPHYDIVFNQAIQDVVDSINKQS